MKTQPVIIPFLIIALSAACGLAAEPTLSIDLGKGVTLDMVLIKKGQFQQGSPSSEGGRGNDERQRTVRLTKDFYMGKYPVTVAQFRRFVEATGYTTEAERGTSGGFGLVGEKLVQRKEFNWKSPGYALKDDCPVTIITYDDAFAFAFWLNDKTKRKCTLPSEAQWEYACRAGTTTQFYSGAGETDLQAIGWYADNSDKSAQPVGKKRPNAFGLFDMSGNVFQWCRDWYGPYDGDATDPLQARSDLMKPDKARRVQRGGSWLKAAHFCRSAARYRSDPASRNPDNGFRVAIELQDDAAMNDGPIPHYARPTTTEQSWCAKLTRLTGQIDDASVVPAADVPQPRIVKAEFFTILIVIIIAIVVIQLIKAMTSSQNRPQFPPDQRQWPQPLPGSGGGGMRVHIEPAADGFWIDPIGYPVGSVIHYRYQVFGEPRHSTAMIETGGRQFIYTGDSPADLVVMQITPPASTPQMPGTQSTWPAAWPQSGGTTPPGADFPPPESAIIMDDSGGGGSLGSGGGSFGEESAPPSRPPASEPSSSFGGYPSAY
jgi:formylglycine-generating enzyme